MEKKLPELPEHLLQAKDPWYRHKEWKNKIYFLPEMPMTFMDITIDGVGEGRIIFMLYRECAKTIINFLYLCTGERMGKSGKRLHYKGCRFHRIIHEFILQAGDIVNHDGTGGESIYGEFFPDENFHHKHRSPFKLAMANIGPNHNSS